MTTRVDSVPAGAPVALPGFAAPASTKACFVAVRDGRTTGALALGDEPFDSEIFGLRVGRVLAVAAVEDAAFGPLYAALEAHAVRDGLAYATRRLDPLDRAEVRALESAGHHLVDVGVVLDHDLRGVARAADPDVRVATGADVEHVVARCAGIFRTSRYYGEPLFPIERADEVHRRWIRNCHRGRADAVLVLLDRAADAPVAFVTCAVDSAGTGDIALFGVDPGVQGRGTGARMLAAALAWFAERARVVHVKTQAANTRALRMYERGGFRQLRAELTYGRAFGARS